MTAASPDWRVFRVSFNGTGHKALLRPWSGKRAISFGAKLECPRVARDMTNRRRNTVFRRRLQAQVVESGHSLESELTENCAAAALQTPNPA